MKKIETQKMEKLSGGLVEGNTRVALCGKVLVDMMNSTSSDRIVMLANAFETLGCGAFY